jgi:CRP-like cAMP-binding protein
MSLERDIAVLRRIPFFGGFSDEQMKLLAFGGQHKRYVHGDTLFKSGDNTEGGIIILSGTVALYHGDDVDKPADETLGADTLIGQRALFAKTLRPSTAVAKGPVETLFLSRELFRRMLGEYPELANELHRRLVYEIGDMINTMGPVSASLRAGL